eukprot:74791-Rhodomonas_salina.6
MSVAGASLLIAYPPTRSLCRVRYRHYHATHSLCGTIWGVQTARKELRTLFKTLELGREEDHNVREVSAPVHSAVRCTARPALSCILPSYARHQCDQQLLARGGDICLCASYAMSGTELVYGAMRVQAESSTDLAYRATRNWPSWSESRRLHRGTDLFGTLVLALRYGVVGVPGQALRRGYGAGSANPLQEYLFSSRDVQRVLSGSPYALVLVLTPTAVSESGAKNSDSAAIFGGRLRRMSSD